MEFGNVWHPQDVTNAEFQRTWRSVAFPGAQLLARLELEMSKTQSSTVTKVLPPSKATECDNDDVIIRHFPDLYGYRGPRDTHQDCHSFFGWVRNAFRTDIIREATSNA